MSLHPVLAEKLSAALEPAAKTHLTLRDARLPAVPGKVHAVIGMRRAGKTVFPATTTGGTAGQGAAGAGGLFEL